MKKSLVALVALYVIAVSWLGFRNADPAIAEAFAGDAGILLLGLLTVVYGTVAALTVWIVSTLTQLTHKLAGCGQGASVRDRIHTWMVVALVARIPMVLGQQFLGTNLGMIALAVPAALAVGAVNRDRELRGPAKAVAVAPFLLYLVADLAMQATSGQV